jgi:ribosome-binding factor A
MMAGAFEEPRLEAAELVSFTEVRVTGDLRHARVFTSIFPSQPGTVDQVMSGLAAVTPRVRALLAKELRLRHTPELRFTHDASIERGAQMEALLDEVRAEDRALAEARGELEARSEPEGPPPDGEPS